MNLSWFPCLDLGFLRYLAQAQFLIILALVPSFYPSNQRYLEVLPCPLQKEVNSNFDMK